MHEGSRAVAKNSISQKQLFWAIKAGALHFLLERFTDSHLAFERATDTFGGFEVVLTANKTEQGMATSQCN